VTTKFQLTNISYHNLLDSFIILLLLLLYDMDISCHSPFIPGTSLEPAVIPTAQFSSFIIISIIVIIIIIIYCN
jgi:hypothetical protein